MIDNSVFINDNFAFNKTINALETILPSDQSITYFCIGSDLSTGDCFGPLTGTLLKRIGIKNVIGSLEETVHAKNLTEKLLLIPKGSNVVAIDATMGHYKDVGKLHFSNQPVRPGAALKKDIQPVGDYSVVFNVAANGFANYLVLGCASLNKVWTAANLLARAISVITYRRKKGTDQISNFL